MLVIEKWNGDTRFLFFLRLLLGHFSLYVMVYSREADIKCGGREEGDMQQKVQQPDSKWGSCGLCRLELRRLVYKSISKSTKSKSATILIID